MNRVAPWILAAILLAVVGFWASSNLERYTQRTWVPPEGDAARPYYVAQRLLIRLGHPVETVRTIQDLHRLSPQRVLIYEGTADPSQARAIQSWVTRGGHLILATDRDEDNSLLQAFGVAEASGENKPAACSKNQAGILQGPPPLGGLHADWAWAPNLEYAGDSPLSRSAAWNDACGLRILHAHYGRGAVTILPGLHPFTQGYRPSVGPISMQQHATLLAGLVALEGDHRTVAWLTQLEDLSLWDWLIDHAAPVLAAAAALLALWLWRVVPRFGPLKPDAPPARRSLLEHLAAAGRLWWTQGDRDALLSAARERVRQRAIRRHPHLAALPPAAWPAALAELTRWPRSLLDAALVGTPAHRRDVLANLTTLQRLYKRFS